MPPFRRLLLNSRPNYLDSYMRKQYHLRPSERGVLAWDVVIGDRHLGVKDGGVRVGAYPIRG